MTRLAVFIDSLARGGTQTALVHLVQGLARRQYSIQVYNLSGDVDVAHEAALRQAGAELVVLGRAALTQGWGLWRLWKTLRAFAPDTLLTMLEYADQLGRVLGRMAGVPRIVSADRSMARQRQRHILLCDRFTAPCAHVMTFNCRESRQQAIEMGLTTLARSVFIPNGTRFIVPSAPRAALRARWGMRGRVVGALARCVPAKRQDVLLRAFAAVCREVEDCTLHIGGEGPQLAALESLGHELGIGERVCFHGKILHSEEFFSAIDIFMHTASHEGMPNVVMEAMCAGLPVIATAVGGTVDILDSGHTGLFVPVGDVGATAAALRYLLDNAEEAQLMGQRAARRMEEEFSPALFVERYDRVLAKGQAL